MQHVDLSPTYFDESGNEINHAKWRRLYPDGRKLIAREACCGLAVSTEFSGVNHNPDPKGSPRVFETIVQIDGAIYLSHWTASPSDADLAHLFAKLRTRAYGWALWRAHYLVRRARHTLQRWLA